MKIKANGIHINYEVDGPDGAPWLILSNSLATNFQTSIANCDPYTNQAWLDLPWYTKAMAWLCFRLRRFL